MPRGRPRILDPEAVKALVQQGKTAREIADAFGVTRAAVYTLCKKMSVQLPRYHAHGKGCHAGVPLDTRRLRKADFHLNYTRSEDGCWLWTGSKGPSGYGAFSIDGRQRLAHRVMWTLTHGEIPKGLLVMHTCDTPMCVRPDHLWVGTQADNLRDMVRKGRAPDYAKIAEKTRATKGKNPRCSLGHRIVAGNAVEVEGKVVCRRCYSARLVVEAERAREHAQSFADTIAAFVADHIAPSLPPAFADLCVIAGGARNADMFARYFALYGYRHFTLEEIGAEYGMTRERVRQLRNRVMAQLGISTDVITKLPAPTAATMQRLGSEAA